jgi:hypothetical protein
VDAEEQCNDEVEEEEGKHEDGDDDFSGHYQTPAMRRRSWRERV